MRYLITSRRSPAQVTLGYDADGRINEVGIVDIPELKMVRWLFLNLPLEEHELATAFPAQHYTVRVLQVDFDAFWKRYPLKEGKKDALKAWGQLSEASRQRAYDYVRTYLDTCARESRKLMYPASYLRAERWLDHA